MELIEQGHKVIADVLLASTMMQVYLVCINTFVLNPNCSTNFLIEVLSCLPLTSLGVQNKALNLYSSQ